MGWDGRESLVVRLALMSSSEVFVPSSVRFDRKSVFISPGSDWTASSSDWRDWRGRDLPSPVAFSDWLIQHGFQLRLERLERERPAIARGLL